jgi:hypothetical protein
MSDNWQLKGKVLVACNCDYGCPCNFNALPTHGKCEGGWVWHIEQGSFRDEPLDGLTFALFAKWPAAIHEGNGEAVILMDNRANPAQRSAVEELLSGKHGGPWGVLAWTWPTVHGPFPVAFEIKFDGLNTRVKCGDHLEVEATPIRNPVSGAEVHPGVLLPEGIIFKKGDLGATSKFRLSKGIEYDHTGKYFAVGPFDYSST